MNIRSLSSQADCASRAPRWVARPESSKGVGLRQTRPSKTQGSGRLGWQPRCKPTVLPSGRILLPLYSDTYSVSLMAISDDQGKTWSASRPLAGFGNIQPAVLRRRDGTLVAYMRENGSLRKVRVAESKDDGVTWGPVGATDLPNPGSGLDDSVRNRPHDLTETTIRAYGDSPTS